jgi:hypothetical protein|tara:strand:+ start:476 stop:898 length:423 start_codon:yes stop_codon:yes gene_type:complete
MYIKLIDGIPAEYTLGKLRRDNPNTSFPKQIPDELLASYSVYPYTRPAAPEYDSLSHHLTDGAFEQVAGAWSLPYVFERQPQDQAERNIRSRRDGLMQETDWMALSDNTMASDWANYRQALRDITGQSGFPYEITWPTKP